MAPTHFSSSYCIPSTNASDARMHVVSAIDSSCWCRSCCKRDALGMGEHFPPKLAPSLGVHRLSDESPTTTTTTTLPTPIIDLPSLHIPQAHSDPTVPRHSHPDDLDVASKSNSTHWPWDQTRSPSSRLAPPGAPLLKDLDSFTEGSSVGSFDFSLPPSPSSPNTYYQPERAFPMAPDPQDLTHAIETWRDGVIMSAAGPRDQLTLDEVNGSGLHRGVKRHHSCMFSDGEWDEGVHIITCVIPYGLGGMLL